MNASQSGKRIGSSPPLQNDTKLLRKILYRHAPNLPMTPDVEQAGLIGMWKARMEGKFDEARSSFTTYAWLLIRNELRTLARERRPMRTHGGRDCGETYKPSMASMDAPFEDDDDRNLHDVMSASTESVEEAYARIEQDDQVRKAVSTLREPDREVVELWMQGRDLQEIGLLMGVTRQRAGQIFKRAKETLAKRLT